MQIDTLSKFLTENKLADHLQIKSWEKKAKAKQQTLFQFIAQHQLISDYRILSAAQLLLPDNSNHLNPEDKFKIYQEIIDSNKPYSELAIIQQSENKIKLFIANPADTHLATALRFKTGRPVQIAFIRYTKLINIHNHITISKLNQNEINNTCLLVDMILSNAIHTNTSDIHLEPKPDCVIIRLRIDGILHHSLDIPIKYVHHAINRIKILANMDISIKRLPQDGRFTFQSNLGFVKEARVSTYPTVYGEKIVVRLLDSDTEIKSLHALGLPEYGVDIFKQIAQQPQGLVLITGPTGSGKSASLYSLLQLCDFASRNITTIEDPIEIKLPNINQSTITPKNGFDFSQALRALLRQDPDIIMVGEIRDKETAQLAVRAAQTGHLVLSTLHTNSAAEAIPRLINMGIAPYQLSQALKLIVSQRLVRRLCDHCKIPTSTSDQSKTEYTPYGCTHCMQGYKGRIGVFEIIQCDERTNHILFQIKQHTNFTKKLSHQTLWEAGLAHVHSGLTSLSELYRVIPRNESFKSSL